MSESKASNYLTFFLVGLGIGAVVALVLAPQPGEETRRYIAEKAGQGKEVITTKGRKVRGQAGDAMAKGRELLMKGRERFEEAVRAGKQTYRAALGQ